MANLIPGLNDKVSSALVEEFEKKKSFFGKQFWFIAAIAAVGSFVFNLLKQREPAERIAYVAVSLVATTVWVAGALVIILYRAIFNFFNNPQKEGKAAVASLSAALIYSLKVLISIMVLSGLGYALFLLIS